MPAVSGKRGRKRKAPQDDGKSGPPYVLTCPALPLELRKKNGDYFVDTDSPGDKDSEIYKDLEIVYTIEPGYSWRNVLRGYSRMRCKYTVLQKFRMTLTSNQTRTKRSKWAILSTSTRTSGSRLRLPS